MDDPANVRFMAWDESLASQKLIDIIDISFDIRESLYFGVTLPENGVLFGYTKYQTPYFDGILRGLARICRFPWTIPDYETVGPVSLYSIAFAGFVDQFDHKKRVVKA